MSRARHLGKLQKRLEDVKSQWVRPARVDFSDNESARLATDALLDGGPEAYWQALSQEGEVDFLSSVEAQYIQAQAKEPPCALEPPGAAEAGSKGLDSCSLQSGTYFPVASEGSEPALLHTWASAEKPYLKEKSSATVYFQTDKHSNIRDLIRRCITRTSQVAMAEPAPPWPQGWGACSPDDWSIAWDQGCFSLPGPGSLTSRFPLATIWLSWPPIAGTPTIASLLTLFSHLDPDHLVSELL